MPPKAQSCAHFQHKSFIHGARNGIKPLVTELERIWGLNHLKATSNLIQNITDFDVPRYCEYPRLQHIDKHVPVPR